MHSSARLHPQQGSTLSMAPSLQDRNEQQVKGLRKSETFHTGQMEKKKKKHGSFYSQNVGELIFHIYNSMKTLKVQRKHSSYKL